jgi:hypothetical protein
MVKICPDPARPGNPPAPEGTSQADFADQVGFGSELGKGHVRRSEDDQRTFGDGTQNNWLWNVLAAQLWV